MTETTSSQRKFAPVFFLLAALVIALGIAQKLKGFSWLVTGSDFVIAGVMIAMGLKLLRPPGESKPRPLRAPRPPR